LNATAEVARGVLSGERRSIARAITIIENDADRAGHLMDLIDPHAGRAHKVGMTGPGGSGKSTVIEKRIREFRRKNKTVGVIAVDPTSPFTGGAFLGDRIRMQDLSTDQDVFIRSMATRNYPGGIARATGDAVKVLDASGKDVVIVETVGAGQSEVEIIRVAQTVVVLFAPGLGDEIQAIKAGLMEIGDIFVVNKADRENADRAVMDIRSMLQMDKKKRRWKPPVLKSIALTGDGIPELVEKVELHRQILRREAAPEEAREKAEAELEEAIKDKIAAFLIRELRMTGEFEELLEEIIGKKVNPASVAESLLNKRLKKSN